MLVFDRQVSKLGGIPALQIQVEVGECVDSRSILHMQHRLQTC